MPKGGPPPGARFGAFGPSGTSSPNCSPRPTTASLWPTPSSPGPPSPEPRNTKSRSPPTTHLPVQLSTQPSSMFPTTPSTSGQHPLSTLPTIGRCGPKMPRATSPRGARPGLFNSRTPPAALLPQHPISSTPCPTTHPTRRTCPSTETDPFPGRSLFGTRPMRRCLLGMSRPPTTTVFRWMTIRASSLPISPSTPRELRLHPPWITPSPICGIARFTIGRCRPIGMARSWAARSFGPPDTAARLQPFPSRPARTPSIPMMDLRPWDRHQSWGGCPSRVQITTNCNWLGMRISPI